MMRPSWGKYFMGIAKAVSERASCPRRKVGCVIVRDGYVLSVGYNGAARGSPHCLDVGCVMVDGSCQTVVHAELNAISAAAHTGTSLKNSTAYVTTAPCFHCARSLVNAGIQVVFYDEPYHKDWPARLPLTVIQVDSHG